jgi:hypothetical protein
VHDSCWFVRGGPADERAGYAKGQARDADGSQAVDDRAPKLVTGACPIDLGIGRRVRPLGPQLVTWRPREVVFDVIAEPYLGRAPRALADKLRVLDRGSDMGHCWIWPKGGAGE